MKRFLPLGFLLLTTACGGAPTATTPTEAEPAEAAEVAEVAEPAETAVIEEQVASEPTTEPETTDEPTEVTSEPSENPGELQKPGDVIETEAGRLELVKMLEVNETFQTGPFEMTVGTINIADFEVSEDARSAFEGRDRVTLVSMGITAKNTSPETLSFYPNQSTIVTDTGEQKTADLMMTELVGGQFIGRVEMKGKVLFALDSAPADINSVKLVVMPPNDRLEPVGEELNLDFTFE